MKNILLLGGSGFVGRHVCAALARQGHAVTVATRRHAHARSVQTWPTVTVREVDVFDEAALNALMPGHDVVVNLIAVFRLVRLPDAIDFRSAAAAMLQGMTAHYLATATFPLEPGHTALVHAAAGGVGLILSQWAKHLGATVIGTVGSPDKAAIARAHGCDHVFGYGDFSEKTRELTGGKGVPVVYDSVGRTTFEGSMKALARRGILASFGEASGDPDPVPPRKLGQLGSIFLTHPSLPDYTATREELLETANDLFAMVGSGKISIEISHTYPLRDAAQAHRDVENRKTTGSVVLLP